LFGIIVWLASDRLRHFLYVLAFVLALIFLILIPYCDTPFSRDTPVNRDEKFQEILSRENFIEIFQ